MNDRVKTITKALIVLASMSCRRVLHRLHYKIGRCKDGIINIETDIKPCYGGKNFEEYTSKKKGDYMDAEMSRATNALEQIAEKANEHFYGGELGHVVIHIATRGRKQCYGWCTTARVWKDKRLLSTEWSELSEEERHTFFSEGLFEICICSEGLIRSKEEIVGTLLHELVHLHCALNGIQDCSREGVYHNKRFKNEAEAHGLVVERTDAHGWSSTRLDVRGESFVEGISQLLEQLPEYARADPGMIQKKKGEGQPRRKRVEWVTRVCPLCGETAKVRAGARFLCAECNQILV